MRARERLDAVHRRIRGQLVQTPIVGGPCVPGRSCPAGLRLKLELLQPSGSMWFRGAMHALARHLGSAKGLVAHGAFRPAYAWATAAALQRVPAILVIAEEDLRDDERRMLVEALASQLEVKSVASHDAIAAHAAEIRRKRGFVGASGIGDADFDDGLATLGLELADTLPSDVERVLIAPAVLARPVAIGLAAGDREIAVEGVEPDDDRHAARTILADALRVGLRVCCEPDGVAALDRALRAPDADRICVVLAE